MITAKMLDVLTELEDDLNKLENLVSDELYRDEPNHVEVLTRLRRARRNIQLGKRGIRKALREEAVHN